VKSDSVAKAASRLDANGRHPESQILAPVAAKPPGPLSALEIVPFPLIVIISISAVEPLFATVRAEGHLVSAVPHSSRHHCTRKANWGLSLQLSQEKLSQQF
jgi:hypothetical protein